MARPKGVRELPRMIQGGALRYFKAQHDKGRPISKIWEDLFKEDQFKAMQMVIQLLPKELLVDATVEDKTADSSEVTAGEMSLLRELRKAREENPSVTH